MVKTGGVLLIFVMEKKIEIVTPTEIDIKHFIDNDKIRDRLSIYYKIMKKKEKK